MTGSTKPVLAIALAGALFAAAGCGGSRATCSAQSCNGCCDAHGSCQLGTADTACGKSGAACQACGSSQACVQQACGAPGPGACSLENCNGCCASDGTCLTPSDTVQQCGVAGSACKVCAGNQTCANGWCVDSSCAGCLSQGTCVPGTSATACGSAGAACAACASGQSCVNGACETNGCVPQCAGKQCGPDGCNGACGLCATGQSCDGTGQCSGMIFTGSVGPSGGAVSNLYFAVVGDTRPGSPDDIGSYPTPIITQIYKDLAQLKPSPQFAIGTGDYMFADSSQTSSNGATAQLALYTQASSQFTRGPIFAAMGNHECDGYTATDCTSLTQTQNMSAFMSTLVMPLGKPLPYYAIPVNASDSSWTAKFIFVACNYWSTTQKTWLQTQLAQPTTFTFVIRHEDTGQGPCDGDMSAILSSATYDALIVGHSHTFQNNYASGKEIIVGNGGAGTGGTYGFGYATFQQQAGHTFLVTDFDYASATPTTSFTIP